MTSRKSGWKGRVRGQSEGEGGRVRDKGGWMDAGAQMCNVPPEPGIARVVSHLVANMRRSTSGAKRKHKMLNTW